MAFANNFRGILKSTVVGVFFLISLSVAFTLTYIFVDYQKYLKTYQASQTQEVEALKKKVDAAFGDITKLLRLTEARIQATYESPQSSSRGASRRDPQEVIQQIQRILMSLHHLPFHQTLPELQNASYSKLSPPQMTVARFGALPLDPGKVVPGKVSPDNREPLLAFEDKAIRGTVPVLNFQNSLEGVLEIQFDLDAFKRFLGTYATLCFDRPSEQNAIEILKTPFPVYAKPPDLFWAYALVHKSHYAAFAFYILFAAAFIGFYLYFLDRRLHKNYRHKFKSLEESLFKTGTVEKDLRIELGLRQQDAQIHQISCQAQKKLQARLKKRQQECASHMALSLKGIQQPFGLAQLGDTERTDALNVCIQEARALSDGLWQPMKKEKVDFKGILDNVQLIFGEKIHQLGITVETGVAFDTSLFPGDSLLMEILLLNAIGKPLHRVPKDGTISVSLKEISGFLHLEVRDNGYAGVEAAEKLIQKSFDLFMAEETFYQACLAHGVSYQYTKAHGFNITHMMIAIPEEETPTDNVVQLFP